MSQRLFMSFAIWICAGNILTAWEERGRKKKFRTDDRDRQKTELKITKKMNFGTLQQKRSENNYENDFLTYVCFELFKKVNMTRWSWRIWQAITAARHLIWRCFGEALSYEVIHTHKLAERILTQMLFRKSISGSAGVWAVICGRCIFRLQQAYLVYMSRNMVEERKSAGIGRYHLPWIWKGRGYDRYMQVAVLKYYSTREYSPQTRKTLKKFLQELCGSRFSVLSFIWKDWLIELQLWDKTLIEYKGQKGSR